MKPLRRELSPGTAVSIVQKQDQRTGKLTEGVVRDILTKSPSHPHGIKCGWKPAKWEEYKALMRIDFSEGILEKSILFSAKKISSERKRPCNSFRRICFQKLHLENLHLSSFCS